MAKGKKHEEVAEAAPEAAEQSAPAEEKETSSTEIEVKYRDHAGEVTSRVFSKEVHGPDFKKLAAEFKETNKARIVA